eukprot:9903842-Karenia_brevis.AAC.1
MALRCQDMEILVRTQNKMFRKMVGWIRLGDEEWSTTMRRMRLRVARALEVHPVLRWDHEN